MALPNPLLNMDSYKVAHTNLKGLKGGNCNRTACQKPGAHYFNKGTDKYYCQECALLINRASIDQLGYALCTYKE